MNIRTVILSRAKDPWAQPPADIILVGRGTQPGFGLVFGLSIRGDRPGE